MIGRDTKPLIYWDSCMFFHAVNRNSPDKAFLDEMDNVLKRFNEGELVLCTSALVHVEVSAERLKKFPKKYAFLRSLYEEIEVIQLGSRVVKLASEIRDFYALVGNTLSTPDVLHLASAIHYAAVEFHTTDGTNPEAGRGKLLALGRQVAGQYEIDIKVPKAKQPNLLTGVRKGITQTASS